MESPTDRRTNFRVHRDLKNAFDSPEGRRFQVTKVEIPAPEGGGGGSGGVGRGGSYDDDDDDDNAVSYARLDTTAPPLLSPDKHRNFYDLPDGAADSNARCDGVEGAERSEGNNAGKVGNDEQADAALRSASLNGVKRKSPRKQKAKKRAKRRRIR